MTKFFLPVLLVLPLFLVGCPESNGGSATPGISDSKDCYDSQGNYIEGVNCP